MSYKYIFRVELRDPAIKQEYIENWRKGSEILQEYPGALGTRLHEEVDGTGLIAIAEWESKEARDFMVKDSRGGESDRSKRRQALPRNEDFGTITVLASINEVAFVPSGSKPSA